ncbi:MAG: recombinase family protein [Selenomonadaceae bacterium]|nr:recombinase family protein [Selenomonadaceae bacterium]
MRVGYVRVSTVEQSEERQIVELKNKADVEKFFVDKVSSKSAKRPKFDEMMNFLREGDELIVSEFSRLARSTTDLLNIVDTLTKKDVKVRSLKEQLDSSTPQGRFMLTIFGAIAEFERELILQRQREGIKLAQAAGKYKGRNAKKRPKDFDFYKQGYYERTYTVTEIAKRYKVSRPTVYKWLRE